MILVTNNTQRAPFSRTLDMRLQGAALRSVELPSLEAVAHKLRVGGLEARAAELEGQRVGGGVEHGDVLVREPPAERARVLAHLLRRRRAREGDGALAHDPVERDLAGGLAHAC